MRETVGIVSTAVLMLSPVLLSGSIAFGAPCRARLALVFGVFQLEVDTLECLDT